MSSWASPATNSEVATMFEISNGTVRRCDKIVLESQTPPPDFDGIVRLLIDDEIRAQGPWLHLHHPQRRHR